MSSDIVYYNYDSRSIVVNHDLYFVLLIKFHDDNNPAVAFIIIVN